LHFNFLEGACGVGFDCVNADAQMSGDLFVRVAPEPELEDFEFSGAQKFRVSGVGYRTVRRFGGPVALLVTRHLSPFSGGK
jgi:hypothetical protein